MLKTYLSVDLDYWRQAPSPRSATIFFKKVFALNLPIMVALHHHHLLTDINSRAADLDTIVNVDFHSDLADESLPNDPPLDFNEGTWGNFVHFRGDGTFVWRYPCSDSLAVRGGGYCHRRYNPFTSPACISGWKQTRRLCGISRIPWDRIGAVGVCLSPGWLDDGAYAVAYPLAQLDLFDWFGRSKVFDVYEGYADKCMYDEGDPEKGTGIFAPHLTFPKSGVCL